MSGTAETLDDPVMALDHTGTNADLMVACRELGYITTDGLAVDLTYGRGTFWKAWAPDNLYCHDADENLAPGGVKDFTRTGYAPGLFDAVVLDPPYKLNGTPDAVLDSRYGVHVPATIDQRHRLMFDGITEAARILAPGGHLLFKCQDQVASGKVHWQTRIMSDHGERVGLRLVDALLYESYRAQPRGRSQVHARRNYSTLLVFKKPAGRKGK